tara:strand:+ start:693 stop:1112 length:420 start_codon:yes stop_codon:yes gene_type:complete
MANVVRLIRTIADITTGEDAMLQMSNTAIDNSMNTYDREKERALASGIRSYASTAAWNISKSFIFCHAPIKSMRPIPQAIMRIIKGSKTDNNILNVAPQVQRMLQQARFQMFSEVKERLHIYEIWRRNHRKYIDEVQYF